MSKSNGDQRIDELLELLIEKQAEKVKKIGEAIVPTLTSEDLLQPMDFPELENNAIFRFEEGVLCGLKEALAAIRSVSSQNNPFEYYALD